MAPKRPLPPARHWQLARTADRSRQRGRSNRHCRRRALRRKAEYPADAESRLPGLDQRHRLAVDAVPHADLHVDQRLVDLAGINAHWDVDDGWAVTGEAEYLVWDSGLSIFGGARYAERSWNFDIETPGPDFKLDSDVEDFQVYAGLKFYFDFGRERTLVEDHRTGAFDNTSVFHEKLPELMTSSEAGLIESGEGL